VAALLVLAGLGLAAIRFAGASPVEDGLDGALGSLALGAPVIATGVLALLAVRDRAILLLPAAIVLVPTSFLSYALVTLPLLIPSALLFVAHRRCAQLEPISTGRAALTLCVVALLLIAAVVVLFVHQDPREYTTATGGGSTSDVITVAEATISFALSAGGVAAGWRLAAPGGAPGLRAGGR
jgi:hypothetical protein